ncbi:MAG TPA: DNA polymerase I [Syntrophomonadaceae bacterium]|nr:DNA polymerase I [Syntrophomonadaceae bacterium]
MSKGKFMLIDGNSLLYRAFYALPLLHNSEGTYTNGVYGFLTMFNRVVAEQMPSHILVTFDKGKKTFRNDIYTEYKANRSAVPDELRGQFQLLRDVLKAMNIDYVELEGYEADDLIGTYSKKAEEQGFETIIVTGDGDTLQLVSDDVTVMMNRKGITETELYNPDKVLEKWEVTPDRMIEIKGLMGDSSDNIPGVPGVGPKTAIKLIKEYGDIEAVYENIENVSGKKLKERLKENREQAFLSRKLATIERNIKLDNEIEAFKSKSPKTSELIALYKKLEFNNFLKALENEMGEGVAEPSSAIETEVNLINSELDAQELITNMEEDAKLSFLLACDYHHPMWNKLQGIYFGVQDKVYYLEIDESINEKLEWIRKLLESSSIKKYTHNAKLAQVVLLRYGIKLEGVMGDTLLLTYVNDPAFKGEDLSDIALKYINLNIPSDNLALQVNYLTKIYFKILEDTPKDLQSLYYDIELPLSNILGYMEFYGVKIDKETLDIISADLGKGIEDATRNIYDLSQAEFNINSPKQLGEILFEKLGLRVIKKTKTGYGTGVEVLEELYGEHEIIPYILTYRQLTKLKSTYADALIELIHPDTGRVHTIFKQAQTATGRLSSVEPNLQNIPIKDEEGRRIRKAFTVQDKNNIIVAADYSQIDLRSLAHISEDQTLIETFNQGIDIHTRTAAEIFHVSLDDVNEDLRNRAKAVNFGIIYGISDFGLARDTGVSIGEAKRYIDNYLASYPGVQKYMEDIVIFGQEHGYVETILKRRRYLPDLNAGNKRAQSFARRMALNTPIQGTSADIIKIAMIKVSNEISARKLQAKILLQVHDDLILELPRNELEEVCKLLKDNMENAIVLKVPLKVSIEYGENWYDMQSLELK